MNFSSYYLKYANKALNWLPMDTKELYKKNLIEHRDLLEKYGWVDSKFTYKFNSLGFRCNNFTNNPSLMFLGCSLTCGIGLPLGFTWAQIVSNALNAECANFGIGGSSPDTSFRYCKGYIDQLNVKAVIYLEPPPGRFEIVRNNSFFYLNNMFIQSSPGFYKEWVSDPTNNDLHYEKNLLAIKSLCQERKIKFLYFKSSDFMNLKSDEARDLKHPGVNSNFEFSKFVLQNF